MEGSMTKKKIFVAGATGLTGKRIVEQLLAKGFYVKAGVRDPEKGKKTFSVNPRLQVVKADVTEGTQKLAEAIGDDTEAVICSTGFRNWWNVFEPWQIEKVGTFNLIDACKKKGVKRFVLVSSILANGARMGQFFNMTYIMGLLLGLVIVAKYRAETYLRASGINYTIIRPAYLYDDPPPGGNIIMEPEDTITGEAMSRDQAAEVVVEALLCPEASYKVIETASRLEAPKRSIRELYGSIKKS